MGMGAIKTTGTTNSACDLENNLIRDTNGWKGRKFSIFVESMRRSWLGIGMFGLKDVMD